MRSNGLYFLLVGLQDLRNESLSFFDLVGHLSVVVDLHCDYLKLVVDQLSESVAGTVVDRELGFLCGRSGRRGRFRG
jgi:hypothetical protein